MRSAWRTAGIAVYMAALGLTANKLRSLLTMLGVIIGVAAVIVAIGIGAGSREAVSASIQRLGTNVLTVRAGQRRMGPTMLGMGSMNTLKLDDAEAIAADCPSVIRVSPEVNGAGQIKAGNRNATVSINGVGEDYEAIENHRVAQGRFFRTIEVDSYKRVCVLGSTTATNLFGTASPLGQRVRISGQTFLAIGVLQSKGGFGFRNPRTRRCTSRSAPPCADFSGGKTSRRSPVKPLR